MNLTSKQVLLAMAQVFEDYPDVWTTGEYAKTAKGRPIGLLEAGAACFCADGFLLRLEGEGACTDEARNGARAALSAWVGPVGITYTNDNKGREHIICAARAVAATL